MPLSTRTRFDASDRQRILDKIFDYLLSDAKSWGINLYPVFGGMIDQNLRDLQDAKDEENKIERENISYEQFRLTAIHVRTLPDGSSYIYMFVIKFCNMMCMNPSERITLIPDDLYLDVELSVDDIYGTPGIEELFCDAIYDNESKYINMLRELLNTILPEESFWKAGKSCRLEFILGDL